MIECDWCDGTGLTPGTGNQCPNCDGHGMVVPDADDLSSEPELTARCVKHTPRKMGLP
jgi:DnaJ-class molecular chaperone